MADRHPSKTTQRAAYEILPFEKDIVEIESKIEELEQLSKETELNLNGEIQGLKERLTLRVEEVFRSLSPWDRVKVARAPGRPLASDYIRLMCDEWFELHGDRLFRDDPAVVTGLARIGDVPCVLVAHRKGRDMKERIACNFGSAHPEGYRKALRKMRLAEKFGLPIVALINTPGAYPGIGAEERGQAWAIAENLKEMFQLKVPIVCVVIGEGGSGGALGIGIGDRVIMLEHAYYSVISPEGCAAILWRDRERAAEAASALRLSASDLLELGVVDDVIPEPDGAAHRDLEAAVDRVKDRVLTVLAELKGLPVEQLLAERYEKFRRMGTLFDATSPLDGTELETSEEGEDGTAATIDDGAEPAAAEETPASDEADADTTNDVKDG